MQFFSGLQQTPPFNGVPGQILPRYIVYSALNFTAAEMKLCCFNLSKRRHECSNHNVCDTFFVFESNVCNTSILYLVYVDLQCLQFLVMLQMCGTGTGDQRKRVECELSKILRKSDSNSLLKTSLFWSPRWHKSTGDMLILRTIRNPPHKAEAQHRKHAKKLVPKKS